MQSKAAKVGFIVLIVLAGIGFLYLKKFGPDSFSHNEIRARYKTYKKAEATVVSIESNGHIGTGSRIIWTIRFTDDKGVLQTTHMDQNGQDSRKTGEKTTVYFDPAQPTWNLASENEYKEVM